MEKVRQHYVWQNHLNKWAANNSIIYTLRDGKIFRVNTEKVGVEKYFYKHIPLSKTDVVFIRKFFNDESDRTKEFVENQLRFYSTPDSFGKLLKELNAEDEKSRNLLSLIKANFHEDYHTYIESNGKRIIDRIISGDIQLMNNEKLLFNHFVATQWMRTKVIRDNIEKVSVSIEQLGANKESVSRFLTYIFSFNLAHTLKTKYKMKVVHNKTNLNFITGQQPVVNLAANYEVENLEPKVLILYYPITPQIALIFLEGDDYDGGEIVDPLTVDLFNRQIFLASDGYVFASNEKDLLKYLR